MNGPRTAAIFQLAISLSAVFFSTSACSVAPVRRTVQAESAEKADSLIGVKDLQAKDQTEIGPGTESQRLTRREQELLNELASGISSYLQRGKYEEAIQWLNEEAERFKQTENIPMAAITLSMLGDVLTGIGQHEKALAAYSEVIALAKDQFQPEKQSDREFVTALVSKIVATATQLRKYEEAIKVLTEAAEVFKQRDDLKLQARQLYLVASKLSSEKLKNNQHALEYATQAFQLGPVEKDASLECEMNVQLGMLYYEMKNYDKALLFLEPALASCEEAKSSKRLFIVLFAIGFIDKEQNKLDLALGYFEQVLKLYSDLKGTWGEEETGARLTEGFTLFFIGQIQDRLEHYEQATEFYRRAREVFQEAGEKQAELGVLVWLALAYTNLGRFQESLPLLQQMLETARELKDRETEASTLVNLARQSGTLGDVENEWKYFLEAIELYQRIGNPRQEAFILAEIARLHQDMSQYDKALHFYHQALSKYQQAKDQKGQREVLEGIGGVYFWVGDPETAARWYQDAVETSRAARDTIGEARALAGLLLVDASLGREEVFRERVRQAQRVGEELATRILPAVQGGTAQQTPQVRDSLLALARLYQAVGQVYAVWWEPPDPAIPVLNIALQIHRAGFHGLVYSREIAIDLYFLGRAYSRLGRYDEALGALQQAEAIARRFSSLEVWRALYRIGAMREEQGKLQEALALYIQASDIFEKVSLQQGLEEVKIPFREGVFSVYQNILRLLYKLYVQKPERHYIEQAFFYYEKGKARVLLDLLAAAKVHVHKEVDPAFLKEEERISTRISRLHRNLAAPELTKEQEKPLLTTLAEQEQALQALEVKMAVANPKYAELTSPQAVDIPQVQAILDTETLLLEYVLGEGKSFLWATTQDGMQRYELPAGEELTHKIEQYLPTLRAPLYGKEEIERHRELGRGLYQTLVQPAATQLQGKSKLIIVPDGNLYYLPFETLIADDAGSTDEKSKEPPAFQSVPYLVKDYTVTYTPSASVLVTLEKTRKTHSQKETPSQASLLAFGDPLYEVAPKPRTVTLNVRGSYEERGGGFQRLEYSAKEVEKIAGVYGISLPSDAVNLREKATEKYLRETDLTRYRVLHFATHAILNDEVKWITQPALVLSLAGTDDTYDGFLQMGEIFNLRLNADLVVLSACETGKGKLHRGEGIIGLTRAFMYAGTPSVVASLWKVNDQSTSLFMEFFYRNLKEGQSKAEALRQAKKQLMQTRVWSDALRKEQSLAAPYFWAPFILIGSAS